MIQTPAQAALQITSFKAPNVNQIATSDITPTNLQLANHAQAQIAQFAHKQLANNASNHFICKALNAWSLATPDTTDINQKPATVACLVAEAACNAKTPKLAHNATAPNNYIFTTDNAETAPFAHLLTTPIQSQANALVKLQLLI